jgi:pantetheine-phosphate adenylyltransferase
MKKRTAVYAGTFDPLTNGHKDIIERSVKVFDRLIIAVAENPRKQCLFDASTRKMLIEESIFNEQESLAEELREKVTVDIFSGLLVEYVRAAKGDVIIRGLRAVSDYEYEAQMAVINRQLAEEIETVFLMTSKRSSFISSSVVRDIARNKGDVSTLVPANVERQLRAIFNY